jgi:ABC-type multidrug transport system fused ATPase/permease subunit
MDEKRSARILAGTLTGHYERRTEEAKIYNERLLDPTTPLPRSKRILYSLLPHREKREHDYRTKWGKKRASLKWSLNDTFGNYFWWGCLFKLVGDTATACTPLVIRAIIAWSREWQFARDNGLPEPVGLHHFFIRSTGTGVYLRAAIITSVYDRSLRLTQKSRGELPNGKLVNHISTDTSRIDFAAGFYGILYTAPIQFLVITIILIIQLKYSALPGIAFLLVATPAQATIMKKLFMLRKRSMVWTDKRAKLLQEILGGMRLVKFMAWEKHGTRLRQDFARLSIRNDGRCHVSTDLGGYPRIHHLRSYLARTRPGNCLCHHHSIPAHANAIDDVANVFVCHCRCSERPQSTRGRL